MKHIAIFASGSGSNAENIARYFEKSGIARVSLILCNNPKAGVLARAEKLNIPSKVFSRHDFYETDTILQWLRDAKTDLVVLAGFLWLVPKSLIAAYPGKIINIHPALLPGVGGKGMYGMKVHETVIQNGATRSGITIHFVNAEFDEGEILFKAECAIEPGDTPETLAAKIHALEYAHFPSVIEKLLTRD